MKRSTYKIAVVLLVSLGPTNSFYAGVMYKAKALGFYPLCSRCKKVKTLPDCCNQAMRAEPV